MKSNQCITKTEIAARMGISMSTLRRYLRGIQSQLPNYRASQKMLTPHQYAVFRDHYCV